MLSITINIYQGVKQRINSPPPNRYTPIETNVHGMKFNVRHASIYKSVLGLNGTGDTKEALAYPHDEYIRPDNYCFNPVLGAS